MSSRTARQGCAKLMERTVAAAHFPTPSSLLAFGGTIGYGVRVPPITLATSHAVVVEQFEALSTPSGPTLVNQRRYAAMPRHDPLLRKHQSLGGIRVHRAT